MDERWYNILFNSFSLVFDRWIGSFRYITVIITHHQTHDFLQSQPYQRGSLFTRSYISRLVGEGRGVGVEPEQELLCPWSEICHNFSGKKWMLGYFTPLSKVAIVNLASILLWGRWGISWAFAFVSFYHLAGNWTMAIIWSYLVLLFTHGILNILELKH